jgi:hypothetical protein
MTSFRSIIEMWPSAEQLGRDLGLKHPSHARVMKARNSVAKRHWPSLLEKAQERGIPLNEQDLEIASHSEEPIQ